MTPRERVENMNKFKAGDTFTMGDVVSYCQLSYDDALDAIRELRDERRIAKANMPGAKHSYYQVRRPSLLLKRAWDRNLNWGGVASC